MRWIFAAIGFLYFRFVGAIAGYFIGRLIERSITVQRLQSGGQRQSQMRVDVLQDFLTLTVAVAQADGDLDRREVRLIRQFFEHSMGFSGPAVGWLRDALKTEVQYPGDRQLAAQRLAQSLSPLDLAVLLRTLIHVAQADGRIDPREQQVLQQIAQTWGLLGNQFNAWQQPARQGRDRRWALNILGLNDGASGEDIERAYKKLVREKHPDRFVHLGDEFQKEAHEQFVEIQEAYRLLK